VPLDAFEGIFARYAELLVADDTETDGAEVIINSYGLGLDSLHAQIRAGTEQAVLGAEGAVLSGRRQPERLMTGAPHS
jgi:hypothetical protein